MAERRRIGRHVVLAGGALLLAWNAAIHAASFSLQSRDPALALRIDPSNPVALVRLAQQNIALGKAAGGGGTDVIDAAKRSIREQPLNAPAFRLYGLVRAANAELEAISAQIAMADRLSRRDLGAQLFLIEDAVRRNDIAGALRHYDTALRVQQSSRVLLYPVLTGAMDEPLIRKRFLPYLAASPPWLESFLRHAISTGKNPAAIAALGMEAGGFPQGDEYSSLDTELLVALEAAGQFQALAQYYRSLDRAPASVLTSMAFTDASTRRSLAPVAWLPYALDGIDSAFVSAGTDQLELESQLEQGYAGAVARKLSALPAGSYRLSAPMRASDFASGDNVRWQIVCATAAGGVELFNQTVVMADRFVIEGSLTVPAGCPVQRIEIIAGTSFGGSDVELTIASPRLIRQ